MRRYLLSLSVLAMFCLQLIFPYQHIEAQALRSKAIQGSDSDLARTLAADHSGNLYLGGSFHGTLSADTLSISNFDWSGYFFKLDSNLNSLWAKNFGPGAVVDLAVLSNNNVVVLMDFDQVVVLDTVQIRARGSDDILLVCFSPSGQRLWHLQIGSTKTFSSLTADHAYAMTVNDQDRIFISGEYYGSAYFDTTLIQTGTNDDKMFVAAISDTGKLIWERHWPGAARTINDMAVDANGNPVFCGRFKSYIDLDTIRLNTYDSYDDGMMVQMDSAGNFVHAIRIGHNRIDNATSIGIDKNNLATIGGIFQDTMIIGIDTMVDIKQNDAFFFQYDLNNKSYTWTKHAKGDGLAGVNGIAVSPYGHIALNCYFADTIEIAKDTIIENPQPTVNSYTLEYQRDGTFIKAHAGSNPSWYLSSGDVAMNDECIFFAGNFRDSLFLPTDTFINKQVVSRYSLDVVAFKYRSICAGAGKSTIQTPSAYSFCYGDSVILYPGRPGNEHTWYVNGNQFSTDSFIVRDSSLVWLKTVNSNDCRLKSSDTLSFVEYPRVDTTIRRDSICGGEYLISPFGDTLSTSGAYHYTFSSQYNCDSNLQIILTVHSIDSTLLRDTICEHDYLISPLGDTLNTTGIYDYKLRSSFGCDSFLQIDLWVNRLDSTLVKDTICYGDYILSPLGDTLSTTGRYSYNLLSQFKCDSNLQIDLFVRASDSTAISDTICEGQYILSPHGDSLDQSGTYFYSLKNRFTCDSIIEINLSVNNTDTSGIDTILRVGSQLTLPSGRVIDTAGSYFDTIPAANGCDSIINFRVQLNIGFNSLTRSSYKVFPNPAKDYCQIEFKDMQRGNIVLFDALGREQYQIEINALNLSIPLASLAPGIYAIVLEQDGNSRVLENLIISP